MLIQSSPMRIYIYIIISHNIQMSYFYSEDITYCECIMPREIGWEVMNQLGQMELVHFQSKQINYENQYAKSLKRCDESIGKINDIRNFINQINPKFKLVKVQSYKDLLKQFNKQILTQKIHGHLYINEIQDEIKSIHDYLSRQKKQVEKLEKDLHEKLVNLALLVTLSNSDDFNTISKQKNLLDRANLFDYKALLINRKDQVAIQKGLFRISKGHCWLKTINIDQLKLQPLVHKDYSKFLQQKIACIIMFQFGQNNMLLNKINRYLSCMQTTTITIPLNRWPTAINQLQAQIKQIQNIQNLTNDAIQRYLHKLYEPYGNSKYSLLTYLQSYSLKQREIYRKLASTTQSKNFLHFQIYIPTASLPLKLNLPQKLPPLTLTPKQSPRQPPTKFSCNEVLQIPQEIVNTYGVPSYKQFNPAVLYIITFGFFIGVMFGDVGHMLMAIPLLIYFRVNKWAWTVVFFMGYSGLIYNQFFGLNIGLFTSCYRIRDALASQDEVRAEMIDDCVYPLGIDSIWKHANNQMQYVNSFKMKLAVILGVTHMMLGLFIRVLNNIKSRNFLSLFTLTIPQIVFMLCTFVYMDFLIIYKWSNDFSGEKSAHAPSIIATMIGSFAGFGAVDQRFWGSQAQVQKVLATIAYLMIPIMLIGVPLGTYLKRRKAHIRAVTKDKQNYHSHFHEQMDEKMQEKMDHEGESGAGSEDGMSDRMGISNMKIKQKGHHNEPMGEIIVHSFIETIEYVLGTVSNTASYLRLWALSLAHGQLSEVIFSLILKSSISGGYGKIPAAFFAFIFYFTVTFGVLICMDSMECFLHSLRLHWVEFQNKFYAGKGYKFQPYNFRIINTA